jgi:hypothetical protein
MKESQRGRKSQYGGALHAGLEKLHARKHTPAPVHPQPQPHAHARPPPPTHTHTDMYDFLLFHGYGGFVNAPEFTLYAHCLSCFHPVLTQLEIYPQCLIKFKKVRYKIRSAPLDLFYSYRRTDTKFEDASLRDDNAKRESLIQTAFIFYNKLILFLGPTNYKWRYKKHEYGRSLLV